MALRFRPCDIAQKTFLVRWRGYDRREVESFLRAVADDYGRLLEWLDRQSDGAGSGAEIDRLLARLGRVLTMVETAGSAGGASPGARYTALATGGEHLRPLSPLSPLSPGSPLSPASPPRAHRSATRTADGPPGDGRRGGGSWRVELIRHVPKDSPTGQS